MTRFARQHHYVPEFYLTGFTPPGGDSDLLCVVDKKTAKSWRSKPSEVARTRDFYRVQVNGVEPDAIEKALGSLEGQAAQVLKKIGETGVLPEGDDYVKLMNLVALMAVRVPAFRTWFTKPIKRLAQRTMQANVSSPRRWYSLLRRMRRDGLPAPGKGSYRGAKEFIERGEYDLEVNQNWQIEITLESLKAVLPFLMARRWSILVAEDNAGVYVTSDVPVVLTWGGSERHPNPPGFGLPGTIVTMPLNSRMSLYGRFEGRGRSVRADKRSVAITNSRTVAYSARFIFSPSMEFYCLTRADGLCNLPQFLKTINRREGRAHENTGEMGNEGQ